MNGKQTFKQMTYVFMKYYESKVNGELNKNELDLNHWKLYQLYKKAHIEATNEIYEMENEDEDIL